MNHWDRLQMQLQSEPPDCLPIALWRHWPEEAEHPRALALATMRWQRRFDFDLVRYMPPNTAAAEYWGASAAYRGDRFGLRSIERLAITSPDQWPRLHPASSCAGVLADCNEGLSQVAQALGGTAPLLQSVTSPLTTAWQLAGDAILEHMTMAPELLDAGLKAIADSAAAFAAQAVASGACGIALDVTLPGAARLTSAQFLRFGRAWDLHVLGAIREASQLDLLDVDAAVPIDAAASYPVAILCRRGAEAAQCVADLGQRFPGILAGGLAAAGNLAHGSRADVDHELAQSITRFAEIRAMISADGPCMLDTPESNIDGAIDAVRRRASAPTKENDV